MNHKENAGARIVLFKKRAILKSTGRRKGDTHRKGSIIIWKKHRVSHTYKAPSTYTTKKTLKRCGNCLWKKVGSWENARDKCCCLQHTGERIVSRTRRIFWRSRVFSFSVLRLFAEWGSIKILSIFVLKSRKKYKSQKRKNTLNESASLL